MLHAIPGARGRSSAKSTPAPVGGWNAQDSLAGMRRDEAVLLDNWFPHAAGVRIRRGHAEHASGVGAGAVESLIGYASGAKRALLACGGGAIHDATAAGGVGEPLATGLANDRWQHVNFAGHAVFVNGADTPRVYDGAEVRPTEVTGTGLAPKRLIAVNEFKSRLFVMEKNSLRAWFLATGAIAGPASRLDLAPFCKLGGELAAVGTWSRDGGAGVDDVAVFVTTMGEVLLFQGTDPASAATWALAGVFRIGAPVGRRCLVKVGPDLVLITADGFVPLSRVLPADRSAPQFALSDRIVHAVNHAVRKHGGNFGWEAVLYPCGNMALFNVPIAEGRTAHQYVVNLTTGAWCRFRGMNANCWAVFVDRLYFGGGDGKVHEADTGASDNGGAIVADGKSAFQYFGTPGRLKRFTMVRPNLAADGDLDVALELNVDFEDRPPTAAPTFSRSGGSPWDATDWGAGDWADDAQIAKDWLSVSGLGTAAALRIKVATRAHTVAWQSTDWLFERGGSI